MEFRLLRNHELSAAHNLQIAELHRDFLQTGFLSRLGVKFLYMLYKAMAFDNKSILIAAVDEKSKVIGFISGTCHIQSLYKTLLKRSFIPLAFILVRYCFSVSVMRRIFDLLLYPFKKVESDEPKDPSELALDVPAELLILVVNKQYHGSGVSKMLYDALKKEFKKRKVDSFKIVVGDALVPAQRFYTKMGARVIRKIEHHKGEFSFLYVQDVI